MPTYAELVAQNRDKVVVEVKEIFNNKTLVKSYSISCNMHVDFGIDPNTMYSCYFGNSKKKLKKLLHVYKASGLKAKLHSIDNDEFYTRIVYRLSRNKS